MSQETVRCALVNKDFHRKSLSKKRASRRNYVSVKKIADFERQISNFSDQEEDYDSYVMSVNYHINY